MNKADYSFKLTLAKGIKYFVIFALPYLVDKFIFAYPEIAQITVGAGLVMLVNYLKNYIGVKLP